MIRSSWHESFFNAVNDYHWYPLRSLFQPSAENTSEINMPDMNQLIKKLATLT